MTQIPGTPPRDYSVQAETAREHVANALQILNTSADVSLGISVTRIPNDLFDAVRRRLAAALALLETQP